MSLSTIQRHFSTSQIYQHWIFKFEMGYPDSHLRYFVSWNECFWSNLYGLNFSTLLAQVWQVGLAINCFEDLGKGYPMMSKRSASARSLPIFPSTCNSTGWCGNCGPVTRRNYESITIWLRRLRSYNWSITGRVISRPLVRGANLRNWPRGYKKDWWRGRADGSRYTVCT